MATFDVIILGGGPAGYVCAIRAAQLGLSTAVVEKDKLGGVCVNIGCIPTKALLHSAYVANLISHDAKDLGVEVGTVKTDYGVAMKRSRKVAEQNSKGVEFLMKKHKVTVIRGTGTLLPGRKVKVGADTHEAKKAVVHRDRLAGQGHSADRARDQQDDGHQLRRGAVPREGARDAGRGRRRGGRLRVRRHLQRLRHQGHADRGAAPDPAARGRRVVRRGRQGLPEARHPDLRRGQGHQGDGGQGQGDASPSRSAGRPRPSRRRRC